MDGSLQFHPGNSTLSGTLVMRFIMEGDAFVGRFGVKLPLHCTVVFDFQSTRTQRFYALPKTHKKELKIRPIVSACGGIIDRLG